MMELETIEIIREVERQFPKELTICVQSIQIRKLQEQLPTGESDDDELSEQS